MGMIQKKGNWVTYELKPRDFERRLLGVNSCLQGKDGRDFCIALRLGTKNGFVTIIPSAENHGDIPAMLPRRRLNRILTVPWSCSALGGTISA
ncbi:mariner Mos1 transposase [Trichonephila clavipes]|nr:mariner Mos1 transposase [Trichonephila clavipes]